MPGYIDCKSSYLLDQRFSIDFIWSVLGSLPDVDGKENPPIGPWTHFMKQITGKSFEPMNLQYLPVIPLPVHDYAVLKAYPVFLNETIENLEIKHIFAFVSMCKLMLQMSTMFLKCHSSSTSRGNYL